MTARRTPGPWYVGKTPKGYAYVAAVGIGNVVDAGAVTHANARLIAAAPELLSALQGVLRVADRATDEFDAARAAIAKATGAKA